MTEPMRFKPLTREELFGFLDPRYELTRAVIMAQFDRAEALAVVVEKTLKGECVENCLRDKCKLWGACDSWNMMEALRLCREGDARKG